MQLQQHAHVELLQASSSAHRDYYHIVPNFSAEQNGEAALGDSWVATGSATKH